MKHSSWTIPTALVMLGTLMLGTLLSAPAARAATPHDFHWGTMFDGGSPRGTIPTFAVLRGFSDEPFTDRSAEVGRMLFGPGPNIADYLHLQSSSRFTISQGGVYGTFVPPDDPDTVGDESTARDSENMSTANVLFFGMQARLGVADPTTDKYWVSAIYGGGGDVTVGGYSLRDWETMALVAVEYRDGLLYTGDPIAIKTIAGRFLRTVGTQIRADGTGYASNDRHFVITKVGGAGNQIVNGDSFTLRSIATGKYLRTVDGGGGELLADLTSPTADSTLRLRKTFTSVAQLNQQVVNYLGSQGLNFAAYDTNRDGVVRASELLLAVVGVSESNAYGGQARNPAGRFRPNGATVDVDFAQAYAGIKWGFDTLTHELAHVLGAEHNYGHNFGLNFPVTVMASDDSADRMAQIDAWNRMRLGWVEPIIHDMTDPSSLSTVLRMHGSSGPGYEQRPLLLYDPARYDLATRSGEYFLLEYRSARGPYEERLDGTTAPSGLALWQVATTAAGHLFTIPSTDGSGVDISLNHLAAPAMVRGNWELWTSPDGSIRPVYRDLTAARTRIRIAPGDAATHEAMRVCVLPDGRADQLCTPCQNPGDIERPRLTLSRLGLPLGDDRLSFSGVVNVGQSLAPPADPTRTGARLMLWQAGRTQPFLDVTLPPGAYSNATRSGWRASTSGSSFRFTSRTGVDGIVGVSLRQNLTTPGPVTFSIKGIRGTFVPSSLVSGATLILDTPLALNRQCGQVSFLTSADRCETTGAGRIQCR